MISAARCSRSLALNASDLEILSERLMVASSMIATSIFNVNPDGSGKPGHCDHHGTQSQSSLS